MQTEIAWAAGFFDGEGCTSLAKGTTGKPKQKPRITISQNSPECLLRFQRAVGLGRIYGPIKTRWTPNYHFAIQNTKGVDTALNVLWPYLSPAKRKQAEASGFIPGTIRTARIGRPKKESM